MSSVVRRRGGKGTLSQKKYFDKTPFPTFKGKSLWFTLAGPVAVSTIFICSYLANQYIKPSVTTLQWPSNKADKAHGRVKRQRMFSQALQDPAVASVFSTVACQLDPNASVSEVHKTTLHLQRALDDARMEHKWHLTDAVVGEGHVVHWDGWWKEKHNHFRFGIQPEPDHTDQALRNWSIAARSGCYQWYGAGEFCNSPHFALVYGWFECGHGRLVLSESNDLTLHSWMAQEWAQCSKYIGSGIRRRVSAGLFRAGVQITSSRRSFVWRSSGRSSGQRLLRPLQGSRCSTSTI